MFFTFILLIFSLDAEKQPRKPRKNGLPIPIESLDDPRYNMPPNQIVFDPLALGTSTCLICLSHFSLKCSATSSLVLSPSLREAAF